MTPLALTLAIAAPLLVAETDDQGLFHMPGEGDFRLQRIAKADNEKGWPFAEGEGYLTCAFILGRRQVYFVGKMALEEGERRALSISNDPFQVAFVNLGMADQFAPNGGLEDLIRRLAPFVQTGERLCDQPRGTEVGPGEL